MKKYKYVFDAEKQIVIDELMRGVIKAGISEYIKLFEEDAIYGTVSQNKIRLYHGTPFRNSFRPVFSAKISEDEQTTLIGKWRLSWFSNAFIVVWYLFLMWVSIVPLVTEGEGNILLLYTVVIAFALVLVLSIVVAFRTERNRMKNVLEYIENIQNRLNKIRNI